MKLRWIPPTRTNPVRVAFIDGLIFGVLLTVFLAMAVAAVTR